MTLFALSIGSIPILHAAPSANPPKVASADWPMYKADAARSSTTSATLKLPLEKAWTSSPPQTPRPAWPEPGKEAHSMDFDYAFQPVAAAGTVCFGSSADDTVRALDATTGDLRWTFTCNGPVRFAPALFDGNVYVASDDGWLYCLSLRTGELVWRFHGAPRDDLILGNGRMISRWPLRSGVLVADGTVYVTAGMWPAYGIYVYALDARTGKLDWCNDSSGHMYIDQPHKGAAAFAGVAPQGELAVTGDKLLVTTGRSVPAAFDRKTGRLLYYHQALHNARGGCWVTCGADLHFNPLGASECYSKARTGELPPRWRSPLRNTFDGKPFAGPGRLGTRPRHDIGGMVAYSTATGESEFTLPGVHRVLKYGQVLYAVGNGKIQALDVELLQSQEQEKQPQRSPVKWEAEHAKAYAIALAASPARPGAVVLAGGQDTIAAFDAATGERLWSRAVDGQARGIAVADGRLFVATTTGTIDCFTRPALSAPDVQPRPRARATTVSAGQQAELAAAILRRSEVTDGYALVVGEPDARLAVALASLSRLHVIGIVPGGGNIESERGRLVEAGRYGTRVVLHKLSAPDRLPFAPWFADLIVVTGSSERALDKELYRVLRPCGGVMLLSGLPAAEVRRFAAAAAIPPTEIRLSPDGPAIVRGQLPGAGDWRYARADPGRTGIGSDSRVRLPLELLWFGGPGPARMLESHLTGPSVLAAKGRVFVLGEEELIAVNAYNGRELWSRKVTDGVARLNTLLFADDGHVIQSGFTVTPTETFVADGEHVYVAFGRRCLEVRQTDGSIARTIGIPDALAPLAWGWVTVTGELIVGTAVPKGNIREAKAVFALDKARGSLRWLYRARGIVPNAAIALADDTLFLLDVSSYAQALRQKRRGDKPGVQKKSLVALDLATGRERWRNDDLPDTTIDRGGRYVKAYVPWDYLQVAEGIVLLSGTAAFDAGSGKLLWHEQHRIRVGSTHDLIHGEWVIGDPNGYNLRTGKRRWSVDPLTGHRRLWRYTRGYGCGNSAGSRNLLFFRSGTLGLLDLSRPYEGITNFAGVRPGCGITTIAAGGLLISPEGSSGCRCSYNFQTSLALAPAPPEREFWSVLEGSWGAKSRIKRGLRINLGATGDRTDSAGQAWLGLPRPNARGTYSSLPVTLGASATWYYHPLNTPVHGTTRPWLYNSGVRAPGTITIRTGQPAGSEPMRWTVRLHFAEPDGVPAGRRAIDVKLQDESVLTGFDIVAAARAPKAAVVREFTVSSRGTIRVALTASSGDKAAPLPPILCAVEVEQTDA